MLASLGGWSWKALCSKRNKVATPFHSNRVERRRHDAPCAGAHTCALKPHRTARPARRARACRLREPHRGLERLVVRKGTRWPNLFIRTAWSGEGMTPRAGARTFLSNRIVHGQRGAPGRPCAPSVPRCFYFGRKTDFACQDVSAAAEKRARWNCRWHPTTAGPMDDCCSLLLAALARAGRAGAHSSVPTPSTACPWVAMN